MLKKMQLGINIVNTIFENKMFLDCRMIHLICFLSSEHTLHQKALSTVSIAFQSRAATYSYDDTEGDVDLVYWALEPEDFEYEVKYEL